MMPTKVEALKTLLLKAEKTYEKEDGEHERNIQILGSKNILVSNKINTKIEEVFTLKRASNN